DLRALARGLADAPFGLGQIFVGVLRAGHLDQADAKLGILHKTIVAAPVRPPSRTTRSVRVFPGARDPMQITVTIPDELAAIAQARGVSLEAYVQSLVE